MPRCSALQILHCQTTCSRILRCFRVRHCLSFARKWIASFFGLHDTRNQSIKFVDQWFIAEIPYGQKTHLRFLRASNKTCHSSKHRTSVISMTYAIGGIGDVGYDSCHDCVAPARPRLSLQCPFNPLEFLDRSEEHTSELQS